MHAFDMMDPDAALSLQAAKPSTAILPKRRSAFCPQGEQEDLRSAAFARMRHFSPKGPKRLRLPTSAPHRSAGHTDRPSARLRRHGGKYDQHQQTHHRFRRRGEIHRRGNTPLCSTPSSSKAPAPMRPKRAACPSPARGEQNAIRPSRSSGRMKVPDTAQDLHRLDR